MRKKRQKAFNEIWKNPIVSNAFEPGSTYKPFTVAAGLEEGILKGNETIIVMDTRRLDRILFTVLIEADMD